MNIFRSLTVSVLVLLSSLCYGQTEKKGEQLKAATITAEPLLKRLGNRISYDVSRDPDADKMDMASMMEKIPELRSASRNGNLEFEDKPIGKILINDEDNGMINKNRQYPMRFIKASYMSKIEVVLPSSREYDNDRPILLITLSRPLPYGFAAQMSASVQSDNSFSPSINAVVNTPLVGIGIGYDFDHKGAPSLSSGNNREMSDDNSPTRSSENERSSRTISNSHNINFNLFRGLFNNSVQFKASLSTDYSESSGHSESSSHFYAADGSEIRHSESSTEESTKSPFRLDGAVSLSQFFGQKIGKSGMRKNQWVLRYSYKDNSANSNSLYDYSSSEATDFRQNASNVAKEHRAELDFKLRDCLPKIVPLNLSITPGYYNRLYDNSSNSFDESGSEIYPKANRLRYRQQVAFTEIAALGSFIKRKFGYMVTLKGEYLGNSGSYSYGQEPGPVDYSEFNVMPSVGLNWNLRRNHFGAGYGNSVKRPNVKQLTTYSDESDPDNILTGNPNLKGQMTHNFSFMYGLTPNVKWIRTINVSASYSTTDNAIERMSFVSEDGAMTTTYGNIGKQSSARLNAEMFLSPAKHFSTHISASYTFIDSHLPSGSVYTRKVPNFNLDCDWNNKLFDFSGAVSLRPTLNSVQSKTVTMEPYCEIFVSRYFKTIHLGASAGVSDLLHSGGMKKSEISYDNYTQRNYAERIGRTLNLRIYWQFGKFRQSETVKLDAYDM